MFNRFLSWIRRWSLLTWLLLFLVVVGALPRFYRLTTTSEFLGDQGRDAYRVAKIFKEGDLVFIGPVTSIGNMYLGPAYYYFMLPWLWLSYPSPLGPILAVATLSTLTIFVLYLLGRELVGRRPALLAAGFFAFSWTAISFARFSWNPNPAPLLTVLLLWSLQRALTRHLHYWWLVTIFFVLLIQLHYMNLLLLPVLAGFALLQLWLSWSPRAILTSWQIKTSPIKHLLLNWLKAGLIAILLLSPLIAFDIKHGGTNFLALGGLLGGDNPISQLHGLTLGSRVLLYFSQLGARLIQILASLAWFKEGWVTVVLVVSLLLGLGWRHWRARHLSLGEAMIYLVLLVALVGLGFYSHAVYPHYLLFLLPVVFWLYGLWIETLFSFGRGGGKGLALLFLMLFLWVNLDKMQFQRASYTFADFEQIAEAIQDQIQVGERYNLVFLSGTKEYYGQNFRFFLDRFQEKAPLDPERDELSSAQVEVVIDEGKLTLDQIFSLPIFELQFLRAEQLRATLNLEPGIKVYVFDKTRSP